MKKSEREHLKEDPFANFIQLVIEKFNEFKREIVIIAGVLVIIAIVIIAVLLLRTGSISKDNTNFASALEIWNSTTMTSEQKIEKLSTFKAGKGVSSAITFYIASLYYQKEDYIKAKEILSGYTGGNNLLDDQKKLLDAEILIALKEGKRGLDILHQLLSDSKSEISKDFLLLRIAKINIKDGMDKSAKDNLNRLMNEFPQSIYQREANELLSGLSE
ncbi:MAG: tetratricopeptide repeat protein [Acidobacteriota bacterium]